MAYTIIMIFIAIICVLLTAVVLLQSGQGGGLSGGIAGNTGGGGGNMMGARRTADFLSKTTSVLAALFLTLCLAANFFIDSDAPTRSTIQERGVDAPYETDFVMPNQDQEEPVEVPGDIPEQPPAADPNQQ
ncbi:MAG: preprotein translocase subunit SecG [Balneolales bacterium]